MDRGDTMRKTTNSIIHCGIALLARSLFVLVVATGLARAESLRIGLSAEPSSLDQHFHNLATNNNIAAHVF